MLESGAPFDVCPAIVYSVDWRLSNWDLIVDKFESTDLKSIGSVNSAVSRHRLAFNSLVRLRVSIQQVLYLDLNLLSHTHKKSSFCSTNLTIHLDTLRADGPSVWCVYQIEFPSVSFSFLQFPSVSFQFPLVFLFHPIGNQKPLEASPLENLPHCADCTC